MFFTRWPFLVGAVLHLTLVFTRIKVLEFRCVADNCSDLIFADFPLSLVYLAFPDSVVIVASTLFGTVLWGLVGIGIYRLLARLFRER